LSISIKVATTSNMSPLFTVNFLSFDHKILIYTMLTTCFCFILVFFKMISFFWFMHSWAQCSSSPHLRQLLGFGFVHLCLYLLLYIFLSVNVETFSLIFLFSFSSFHDFLWWLWMVTNWSKETTIFLKIENGLTHNFQAKYWIFHDNTFICYDVPHCM